MTDDASIQQGLPDTDATLNLLNEAFGDWGDEARLEWRYQDFPGYDDEHTFSIRIGSELVALRRLFEREIVSDSNRNYDCYVQGDTCVAPSYQGEGLYSKLYEETAGYCQSKGSDLDVSFNRVGNITYEAKLNRGWQYRTLPVQLRILSPEVVLPEYAQLALDDGLITSVLELTGRRFGLSFTDARIRLRDFVTASTDQEDWALYVPIPDRLLTTLVELITSDDPVRAVRRHLVQRRSETTRDNARTTVREPPIDAESIDALHELYGSVTDEYDLHFRRNRKDVEHMLAHPSLEALVTAERDDELVAAAPLCLEMDGNVLEAQVLDVAAVDNRAFAVLRDEVESVARERNADAIVMITDYDPGSPWVCVDRQVMMWDSPEDYTAPLANESLRVGLYDVT